MVEGQYNGAQGEFYTRAGQFQLDRDGFVVTDSGLKLRHTHSTPMKYG